MISKSMLILSLLLFISPTDLWSVEKTPSPDELLRGAAQALHFKKGKSTALMTITKAGKDSESRKLNMWFATQQNGYKLLIKIVEPTKLRGTGFLTIKTGQDTANQWLYLPAYKKSRKIRRGNENESFVGSDFTFADLNFENQSAYEFKVHGDSDCGAFKCYLLVGTAKADRAKEGVAKKHFYIRKSDSLNIKTDYFDSSGKIIKVMTLTESANKDLKVKSLELRNLSTGNKTVLEFLAHSIDPNLADTTFSLSFLER